MYTVVHYREMCITYHVECGFSFIVHKRLAPMSIDSKLTISTREKKEKLWYPLAERPAVTYGSDHIYSCINPMFFLPI